MSSGFLFSYTLAELQSTTQSSFKLKFNSTLTVFIVNKSAFFIFQNRPCFTAAFLSFSPCYNPLCYSAKLSKSSAVNYLVNSFSAMLSVLSQRHRMSTKIENSLLKGYLCVNKWTGPQLCPFLLLKASRGEEGILKLVIKISAALFCKRSRAAGRFTGMIQIKQTNIQSADIYIVLQTWTARETKLVRFFLKLS